MNVGKLNASLTLGANIGVLIGLIVLIVELNQNTDHLRLQVTDQINAREFTHNLIFLAENPAPVIEKSLIEPENITYTEFRVLDAYLITALSLWEARFFLYQGGLVDSTNWKTKVEQDASWYFGNKFAKKWWENAGKDVFEKEFADHVDQVLRNMGDDESYEFWLNSQIISAPSKE